tara:strand:- start:1010 stop:1288 length:279 start_codon:yes stop_codon:yes gene_type:complete
MADRIYRKATPVVAGQILAKNGVMVLGNGIAHVKFYKDVDYSSGLTLGEAMGTQLAADEQHPITGTAQGTIVPISVHTLVSVASGTTVYKLA